MPDTEAVELDLGDNGGRHVFRSYEDLRKFVDQEREAWAWMREASEPSGNQMRMLERIAQLRSEVDSAQAHGRPLAAMVSDLPAWYAPGSSNIVHRASRIGIDLLQIKDMIGHNPAAFAYSFSRGWANLGQVTSIPMLQAVLTLAHPGFASAAEAMERLKSERERYRSEIRRITREAAQAEENRAAALLEAFRTGRRDVLRWGGKRAVRWRRYSTDQQARGAAAVDALHLVTKTYEERMALQAPSTYWRLKAKAHKRAEGQAALSLAVFFALAIGGLSFGFYETARYFLALPTDPRSSVYFVASAGLATIAGLILWIGRLLSRLYLSEHHLRKDAEERRIMTTTYLALMRKAGVGEADRSTILAALFRSSSDGIVKDDGAGDIGISSLVSRFGLPR